jgi:hypothetical protein
MYVFCSKIFQISAKQLGQLFVKAGIFVTFKKLKCVFFISDNTT